MTAILEQLGVKPEVWIRNNQTGSFECNLSDFGPRPESLQWRLTKFSEDPSHWRGAILGNESHWDAIVPFAGQFTSIDSLCRNGQQWEPMQPLQVAELQSSPKRTNLQAVIFVEACEAAIEASTHTLTFTQLRRAVIVVIVLLSCCYRVVIVLLS